MLREAGIPFEVVPGHHRRASPRPPTPASRSRTASCASGVAFVTGHEDPDKPETALDWAALARFPGTLVFYMGVRALPRIAERLHRRAGAPADEPVAVVERGTLPGQRTRRRDARRHRRARADGGIRAPAITLVGAGRRAARGARLARARGRCTAGRSPSRARGRRRARWRRGCATLGADVVEAPAIRTQSLRRASCPTSPATTCSCVDVAQRRARAASTHLRDARDLAGVRVAAIGPGTARALREHGIEADIVPERVRRRGAGRGARGRRRVERVLIARGAEGRDVLPDALRERGAQVDVRRALRDRRRAARRAGGDRPRPRADYVHLHLRLDRALLSRRRARTRSAARGSSRSARPPAPSCAPTASSPTSRPTRTPPTAWSTRCSPTREARQHAAPDHLPLRLRARATSSSASCTA